MQSTLRMHSSAFIALGLLIICVWAFGFSDPPSSGGMLFIYGAILLLGLPHGALDLFIAQRAGLWRGWVSFLAFHALYLVIAGLVVISFLIMPVVALAVFLLVSIWHFSDDWPALPRLLRLAGAGAIVILPVIGDPEGVGMLFRSITNSEAPLTKDVPYLLYSITSWLVAGAIVAAWSYDRRAAVEMGVVALMAFVLPALVFFAAYFVLLHSPRHLLRHGQELASHAPRLIILGYTALSIILVATLMFLMPSFSSGVSDMVLRGVFIGLAALTLPHVLLLEYGNKWWISNSNL